MVMGCFATDTAVTSVGEHRWQAELKRGWRVGKVPNGGYVLAIVGQAISASLDGTDPWYQCLLPRAHRSGEATIDVEPLRTGKGHQYATARLMQEGWPQGSGDCGVLRSRSFERSDQSSC